MKRKYKLFSALICALALTSCGAKEVDYATFDAAAEMVETITYSKATVNYEKTYKGEVESFITEKAKYEFIANTTPGFKELQPWVPVKESSVASSLSYAIGLGLKTVNENKNTVYYLSGSSFKTVTTESFFSVVTTTTKQFNKYGWLVSFCEEKSNGESYKYSIRWSN